MSILEQLNAARQIFLDTAPVIYFVENHPNYAPIVQPLFERLDENDFIAVVSPITLAECLVLPYRLGKPNVAKIFTELLVNSPSVLFSPLDDATADLAAELRARYNLALADAFQIAVAIQTHCDAFLTNDVELKRITEIPIFVISEIV
jgi:predicted nucleic acid-binding protein